MKRRTRKQLVFAGAAALLAAFPVLGSVYYSYRHELERADARLGEITADVGRHASAVVLGVEATLADLVYDARDGCDANLISQFGNKVSSTPGFRNIGYVSAEGLLTCTGLGKIEPPLAVGEIDLMEPDGSLLGFSTPLETPFMPGLSIVAMHRLSSGARLGIAFDPGELVDTDNTSVAAGDVHVQVSLQGRELAAAGTPPLEGVDTVTAIRALKIYDLQVTATASRSWALAGWRHSALINVGFGAAVGVVLVLVAARLASQRLSLTGEMTEALENGEFEVFYQPVIDIQEYRCSGAEALLRWRHPDRGMVSPDVFVGIAEETGQIVPITRWLMGRIGEQVGSVLRDEPRLHIGINLAPPHFENLDVVADARAIAESHGLDPKQLLFEATERGLMDDEACQKVIDALNAFGSEVALDDFGTGYSSLAYLEKFKLDYLKIDKAFVSNIGTDAPTAGLSQIIIEMAKSLNMKLIAEGVETEEQMHYLRDRGVQYVQGWFYSKPLPADEFLAYLRAHAAKDSLAPDMREFA